MTPETRDLDDQEKRAFTPYSYMAAGFDRKSITLKIPTLKHNSI